MTKTRNSTYNTLIMRELLPPPISSCRINITSSGDTTPALLHRSMTYCGRFFMCLCLIFSTFFFASCESYEDPSHLLMQGYFEESQGLSQASTDSVARFSQKVNEFTTRIPEAKNDPHYTQIQSNIKMAKLKITITIADEWEDDVVIKF